MRVIALVSLVFAFAASAMPVSFNRRVSTGNLNISGNGVSYTNNGETFGPSPGDIASNKGSTFANSVEHNLSESAVAGRSTDESAIKGDVNDAAIAVTAAKEALQKGIASAEGAARKAGGTRSAGASGVGAVEEKVKQATSSAEEKAKDAGNAVEAAKQGDASKLASSTVTKAKNAARI